MRTIFKYPLGIVDRQIVEIPRHSRILSVQMQNERICLWALVDPGEAMESVAIRVHGTGHPLDDDIDGFDFTGTVQIPAPNMPNGSLVFHVFDKRMSPHTGGTDGT